MPIRPPLLVNVIPDAVAESLPVLMTVTLPVVIIPTPSGVAELAVRVTVPGVALSASGPPPPPNASKNTLPVLIAPVPVTAPALAMIEMLPDDAASAATVPGTGASRVPTLPVATMSLIVIGPAEVDSVMLPEVRERVEFAVVMPETPSTEPTAKPLGSSVNEMLLPGPETLIASVFTSITVLTVNDPTDSTARPLTVIEAAPVPVTMPPVDRCRLVNSGVSASAVLTIVMLPAVLSPTCSVSAVIRFSSALSMTICGAPLAMPRSIVRPLLARIVTLLPIALSAPVRVMSAARTVSGLPVVSTVKPLV